MKDSVTKTSNGRGYIKRPPTVTDVVQDLVRKGWVLNKRSIKDRRTLPLNLSRKGEALVRKISPILQGVEAY
jgi:DNA-binding MarR family transcriptional regulator